ncbi:type I polyketide synthase [Streptomyces sp. NL15-2K]|uniref:type I polyketide synthase n=1 Tax=Streptomyces sp. NL15-2K TaxID=376149 RepID=UPI000F570F6E|nr:MULTISPECIES: beta-ketoacyl synthase N-terminal-like domain-containing protein [Actinomycetes]WKX06486.1 beta-ketoacyl synthase N-terminal-like domain-containing protein [Kutzneria buriramensis]GCB43493.1 malonyl CoA-acyl carrier protein transacylase [Streptomyces sp. NL15-2K]
MTHSDSDVAIIGMACRFPGADSVDRFWEVLSEGRETLTRYTDEELLAAGVPADRLADPRYVKAAQTIPGTDLFDSELFQFTHDEAEILDPQHRVFLECALQALERAGYDPERTDARIGVYAGAGMNTYLLHNLGERYRAASSVDHYRLMLANDKDFLSTRVSYKLNLTGPSVSINTACSTSLVAVHTACLALLGGECDMALVGAVHLSPPNQGYQYQEGMIFSPDGHCRAFDAEARGTVIGSGAGAVVLKRLPDALADGDWIHAVIKGSAINNDGSTKTGYTAPSVSGQAAVIADAQDVADVEADTIGYVEAHGTGTPLGDPIEVAALTEAFRHGTERTGYCALGSVKTNIGHLDTAAGMAGLIKTALMLEHRTLVPSLHFTEPNPDIDFAAGPFFVNTEKTEWKSGDDPLRAGVSSFGIGGTNAHVILQEAPDRIEAPGSRQPELLVLSARSEEAVKQAGAALARQLRARPDLDLAAVAQTLALGRRAHPHRLALVAGSTRSAAMALALGDEERIRAGVTGREPGAPVLVLTGTGADPADTAELYRSVPAYRDAADACAAALGRAGEGEALLTEDGEVTAFCHEYALATALTAWGVTPAGLAATGTGLAVAAALTEALPLSDALALARGTAPVSVAPPRLPVVSPRTGRWMTEEESREPGNWAGTADLGALDALLDGTGRHAVHLAPQNGEPCGLTHLLTLAADQWVLGADLDFAAVHAGRDIRRVPLPTHRFERRRHWVEPGDHATPTAPASAGDRLIARFDPADPHHNVELVTDYLTEEIGKVLGGRHLAPLDSNLFDLGLDSLVLIEVVAKLGEELDFEVPATSFLEFPTIRSFADNLADLMGIAPATDPAPGEGTGTTAPAVPTSRRAQRAAARRGGQA